MSAMALLIDTDVLLDFLIDRGKFSKYAKTIIQKSHENTISIFMAAHSITNIFYILRKTYSALERKKLLLNLCLSFNIVDIGRDLIFKVLENNDFYDIEDCLQAECAAFVNADYIVTRNVKDYSHSKVPALLPEKLLGMLRV